MDARGFAVHALYTHIKKGTQHLPYTSKYSMQAVATYQQMLVFPGALSSGLLSQFRQLLEKGIQTSALFHSLYSTAVI